MWVVTPLAENAYSYAKKCVLAQENLSEVGSTQTKQLRYSYVVMHGYLLMILHFISFKYNYI